MALSDLKNVLKIFGGGEPTPEETQELFKEALLMTLARASSSDTNMAAVEVETVQKVVTRELGVDVTAAEIKVAGSSALFETTPLDKYLVKVSRKLDRDDRMTIMRCLFEVLQSDLRVSVFEIDFFNMVGKAMNLSPADLAGLSDT